MAKFTTTGLIKRTPQDVFNFIADPDRLAEWQANTEHAEWISTGEPGVGSTFKVVTNNNGKKTDAVMQITIWDPPNRHGFKSIEIPFPLKGVAGITTLTPTEDGTQMTLDAEVEMSGIFKLIEGLLTSQVKKQDIGNMNTMKQLLEGV